MSWLSKAVGGKTLKIGAAILGSTVAKEYLFGETSGGYYTDKTFVGSGLKKLGIPAFGDTKVGSFLSPMLDSGKDLLKFGTEVAGEYQSLKYSDLPSIPLNTTSGVGPVRTNTSFQAGRAAQIPIGRNGSVNRALANANVQSYLAKRAKMIGLPAINTASPTVTTKAALASTTSARRRARSKLVG